MSSKKSSGPPTVRPMIPRADNPQKTEELSIIKPIKIESPKASETDAMISQIVGNYEIREELTKVPYGSIHKCLHISSGLPRTVKILDLKCSESVSMSPKHLEAEVKALRSLDHPNILKIHDIFYLNNKYYTVMEPWDGRLLIDCITEMNHLSESIIADVTFQILSAVAYCHSNNVIHRDLNPKIIFMSDPSHPRLKVAEFGASSFVDPENKLGGKRYSKTYIAPEVPADVYNEKCDMWSVGAILHLLLTGDLPFYNRVNPTKEITELDLDGLSRKGISPDAIDLLSQLLEKDYTRRISAVQALQHLWISKMRASENNSVVLSQTLDGLKKYKKYSDAQDAIREFVAGQIVSFDDSQEIVKAFRAIDTNWDGKISREELLAHYTKSMQEIQAKAVVDQIFETTDRDKSGYIEFAEFVKASMKKKCILSMGNIEKAFKLLDTDNSEKLSKTELQTLLGESADKNLMKLIAEADVNGDGEIDFTEFYNLLKRKYES